MRIIQIETFVAYFCSGNASFSIIMLEEQIFFFLLFQVFLYLLILLQIVDLNNVKKNISDKLKEFHFPNARSKIIMLVDIFVTFYNCETKDYDDLVSHYTQEKLLKY